MVRLFEYQGKALLKQVGIPVALGEIATTPEEARHHAAKIGRPVVIKAQILATGRFKAGGIKFANDPTETEKVAAEILGHDIKGSRVEKVLIEEKLDVKKEFYAGVIVDDSYKVKGPTLIFSTYGGVDLEEVALKHPTSVMRISIDPIEGLTIENVENYIRRMDVAPDIVSALGKIVWNIYNAFERYDARSVEVNPIVLTNDGKIFPADCRIVIDEASIFRHPELGVDFPRDIGRAPTDLERRAWRIEQNDFRGTSYFVQMVQEIKPNEGYIGFHGIGGGGAMLGADALIRHGVKIADYADTSGNPTASKVYRTVKIILSQQNIEGYALMGAVIANQEQWHHAHALVRALREELASRPEFPVVILIAGNKEGEAIEILKEGLKDIPAKVEIYGREHVYDLDFIADRMKTLIGQYREYKLKRAA